MIDLTKAELISDVSKSKTEPGLMALLKLIDLLILEVRKENDTAMVRQFMRNQGKTMAYEQLKSYIIRGLPGGIK